MRRRHQKREDVRWEEVTDFTPVDIPFNEVPGPSHPMQGMTPLNILMMFFNMELLEMITTETNHYYSQCQRTNPSSMKWTNITVEEIMAYIGVVIAMGIVRLPEVSDYWSTSGILQMSWFSSIFSHNHLSLVSIDTFTSLITVTNHKRATLDQNYSNLVLSRQI